MSSYDPEFRSGILVPRTPAIIIPGHLIKPLSPHERRLERLRTIPSQKSLEGRSLQRKMDRDLDFQIMWRNISSLWPYRLLAKRKDGSGLHMSKALRWYLSEYTNRYSIVGPNGFPSSFNILEAFISLFEGNMLFDLRKEIEHIASLNQYYKWYRSNDSFEAPNILENLMDEGKIYSYDMLAGSCRLTVKGDRDMTVAGISMIRHEHELSCLLLSGESIDGKLKKLHMNAISPENVRPGREDLIAGAKNSEYTIEDSFLEGYEGLTKVLLLARIDLRDGRFDARNVQIDMGNSFKVLSDEKEIFDEHTGGWEKCKFIAEGLTEYSEAFSVLASLIYLPVYFSINSNQIQNLEVYTELGTKPRSKEISEAIKKLGHNSCITKRSISFLPEKIDNFGESPESIIPPPIEMKTIGYWKELAPTEIGEGKNGEILFGRTWVTRTDNWVTSKTESFLVQRSSKFVSGPDPGMIYIQRCPGHTLNLYKIGLTRRDPSERAKELSSSTGVPLPFGVLASWLVGDCKKIESIIHDKLQKYRINSNREFFMVDLSYIVKIIEISIKE